MGTLDRKARKEVERQVEREPSPVPSSQPQVSPPTGPFELLGNRAILHLLRSGRLQRKPRLSEPGEPLEEQADRAAEAVLRASVRERPVRLSGAPSTPQRTPLSDAGQGQSAPGKGAEPTHEPPAPAEGPVSESLGGLGSGQPLDEDTRVLMESRFGESFSGVRVHAGAQASDLASSLQARAFTVGQDIVFGEHEYAPETSAGQRLLAHELAHVVQQQRGPGAPAAGGESEQDADLAASAAEGGLAATVQTRAPPGTVQKQEAEVSWHSVPAFASGWPQTGYRYLNAAGTVVGTVDGPGGVDPVVEDVSAWEGGPDNKSLRVVAYVQGGASTTRYKQSRWTHVELIVEQAVAPLPVPPAPTPVPPKVQPPGPKPTRPSPPPPKAPPPKAQPPAPQPPEPQPTAPQEEEPKAPAPTESELSGPSRIKQALKSDPSAAAALAPQLSNAELETLDSESRLSLLQALAGNRVGDQLDVPTVNRLLETTPDRDVGALQQRLEANNGQLRVMLETNVKGDNARLLGNGLMNLWTRSLFVGGGPGGRPDWLNNPWMLQQGPHAGPPDANPVHWLGDAPSWAKGMAIKTDPLGNWTVFTKDHPPLQVEGVLSRALRAEQQELAAARRRARALPLSMRVPRMKALAEKTWTGSESEEEVIEMIEHPDDFEKKQLLEALDAATVDGKPLIDRLDQVIDGDNNFRLHVALSKLRMSMMSDAQLATGLTQAMVLPWHDTKVNAPATFFATRQSDGRIRVKMSVLQVIGLQESKDYGTEARKLPLDLYTGEGMVFDPNTPFIIHDYDANQDVVLLARDLVGYQHKGTRKFAMDTVEIGSIALPVAAGGRAALTASAIAWDAAQVGLMVSDEFRVELRKSAPELLTFLDAAKMVIAARGLAALARSSPAFIRQWRQAFQTFKARRAMGSFAGESASSSKALAALENETEVMLTRLAKEEAAASGGARASDEWSPPSLNPAPGGGVEEFFQVDEAGDVFKVVVNRATGSGSVTHLASGRTIHFEGGKAVGGPAGLLPQNVPGGAPMAPRAGPGGGGVPGVLPAGPVGAPVPLLPGTRPVPLLPGGRTPLALGPGPGPTLVSFDDETLDALEQMWKTEIANNPARKADFEAYIKNLRERRNLLKSNPENRLGEQSEREVQFVTQSRHKRVHTPEGKTIPDFTQGTDWAGEVKNWNVLYPSEAELIAAEKGLLPSKLQKLVDQVAQRRLIYGNRQTVVIDVRGQLSLQGVDPAKAAYNRYLLHQVGRTVADATGLPIHQIQILTW